MKKSYIGELQVLLSALMFSTGGILIKSITWHPLVISGIRSLVAAATVLLFILFTGRRIYFNRRVLVMAVFLCGTFMCFVLANKLTTSANAIVLQFSSPIYILIFSALFLKKKIRPFDAVTVMITLSGIILFLLDGIVSGNMTGDALALLSGVFLAVAYISIGENQTDVRMSGILFAHLLTALIGIPFVSLYDTPFTGQNIIFVVAMGVIQLAAPYLLLSFAMNHCSPLACTLLGTAEPLLNPVWVLIFDGEMPSLLALAGGVIVVTAVTVWCIRKPSGQNEAV